MSYWADSTQGVTEPMGIVVDSSNEYLYVANYGNGTISKISISNPTGDYTADWVNLGTSFQPRGLAIDNTYLYVSSWSSNGVITRILISDPSTITNGWATGFGEPNGIAIYNTYLYVASSGNSTISRIPINYPDGATIWVVSLSTPLAIAIDSTGTYMYVSNQGNSTISKITIEDTPAVTNNWAGGFSYLRGIAIGNNSNYLYALNDNGNNIAQVNITNPSIINYSWATGFDDAYYNAIDSTGTYMYVSNYIVSAISRVSLPAGIVCFKNNSKILTDKGYIPIQDLKKGDLVKTLKHGFRAIDMIGKRKINHQASKDRIKDQLYKCSKDKFAEVFEDLIITGCHSILVDDFISQEQEDKTRELLGDIYFTDGLIRLPACVDERTLVYEVPGTYTIYHLALENENDAWNYAIYANGLLVETCSSYYLKELSNMTLIK
jgi:DNA-binding beta-propeller fold protein YncE